MFSDPLARLHGLQNVERGKLSLLRGIASSANTDKPMIATRKQFIVGLPLVAPI